MTTTENNRKVNWRNLTSKIAFRAFSFRSKSKLTVIVFLLFLFNNSSAQTFIYPATPKHPVADTLYGKVVIDNYRWMEDVSDPKMQEWLKAQNDLTNQWLVRIPGRDSLAEAYKKLDKMKSADIPYFVREGGRYFYMKSLPGENVPKLYYKKGETGKEVLLFDPHNYTGGKSKEITYRFLPAHDGKNVALAITDSGNADILTVRVINVDTKQFYSDSLYPTNGLTAWAPDNKGFIYSALQTGNNHSNSLFHDIAIKYHSLGRRLKDDKTILSRINNPSLNLKAADLLFVKYSPDFKYLIATIWSGDQDEHRMLFATAADFEYQPANWKLLAKVADMIRDATIYKNKVYLISRRNAPHFKVVVSPINNLNVANAKVLVPESNQSIEWISMCRDYLFINKTDGINAHIDKYNVLTSKIEPVQLPFSGSAWMQELDNKTNDCVMHISSWVQPDRVYDYNPVTGKIKISPLDSHIKYPGLEDLTVEEIEIKSHDGVMVPLSLIYKKDLKRDGQNIVYMTGYGSYGDSAEPYFDLLVLPLLNKGVIIAITHPRGGGEKGYTWHMGGFKNTKPNTWKDFIACGEYLIDKKYTSAKHLIGDGTSAGGILIGRAMTERPDLFAAAVNNVPLCNVLRGENRPNGALDAHEFGTVKDSVETTALIEMDAYLHVKQGTNYPAVIAISGINDTRVPVWQPSKLVAALQSANTSDRPILLMVNYDSGHWSEEKFVTFRSYADRYAFALWQAGHKDFQPK